jgi:hypothetical protein
MSRVVKKAPMAEGASGAKGSFAESVVMERSWPKAEIQELERYTPQTG